MTLMSWVGGADEDGGPVPARIRPRIGEAVLRRACLILCMAPVACSVDHAGIDLGGDPRDGGRVDLPGFPMGSGGARGTGGADTGTGGSAGSPIGSGGLLGSGGAQNGGGGNASSGGTMAGGGAGGGGGNTGTGGNTSTGGNTGTGGVAEPGTGGSAAGAPGSGGDAVGGAPSGGGAGGLAGRSGGGAGAGGHASACNPDSCPDGCCSGDRCITNLTSARCGSYGRACAACADCLRCSSRGVCEVDPGSTWGLTAVSAVLDPLMPNGDPWDGPREKFGGSEPDPFVQLEIPVDNAVGYTSTLVDTTIPAWNEPLALGKNPGTFHASDVLPGGQMFELWVGDEDTPLSDVMCAVTDPFDPDVFLTRQLTFTNIGSCQSLVLSLVCNP